MERDALIALLEAAPRQRRFGVLLTATDTKQADVASRVGCTPGYISSLANGHAEPSLGIARSIAEIFGLPIEAIWPAPPAEVA